MKKLYHKKFFQSNTERVPNLVLEKILIICRFVIAGSSSSKSLPTTSSTAQPRFLSRGHTYRAVVGETLVLPCKPENLGESIVLLFNFLPFCFVIHLFDNKFESRMERCPILIQIDLVILKF